ncbi:MAG: class III extradiol ring-cleavage dioxygenase, partial [Humibacillus sp.]
MTTPLTTPTGDCPGSSIGNASGRTPLIYLSHGAPPLADDEQWKSQLASWSSDLTRPESVLIVSAHWEDAPMTLGSTTGAPLTYDFWGFPQRYYDVTYDAPAAPALADEVTKLLTVPGTTSSVHRDEARGLDHGAYVPLKEMFPEADVPVLQMSMPTLDPRG